MLEKQHARSFLETIKVGLEEGLKQNLFEPNEIAIKEELVRAATHLRDIAFKGEVTVNTLGSYDLTHPVSMVNFVNDIYKLHQYGKDIDIYYKSKELPKPISHIELKVTIKDNGLNFEEFTRE